MFIFPNFHFRVERWKFNKEYGVYVSTLGNFKDRHKRNLPIKLNSRGYCLIKTEAGQKLVHRLVMLTWKPTPNAEDLTVDHLNHNKRENTIYNLEWVTRDENWARSLRDVINGGETERSFKSSADFKNKYTFKVDGYEYNSIDETINAIKNNSHGVSYENCLKTIYDMISGKNSCGKKTYKKSTGESFLIEIVKKGQ